MSHGQLVSVIIPTRERFAALERCLRSVLASTYAPIEVIVVDDASSKDMSMLINSEFPSVRVLKNESRQLLAATRNRGASVSRGDFLFFLDDDNVVERDAIGHLVEGIQGESIGVSSPLIFHASAPDKVWYAGAWMSPASGIAVFPYRGGQPPRTTVPYETAFFHDAFLVRRTTFESVKGFDYHAFPIYLSEADFSEKMRKIGWSAVVVPSARVYHDVPVMRGTRGLLRNVHITEPSRAYYVARNRIIFMRRYRNPVEQLIFFSFFLPGLAFLHLSAILASEYPNRVYLARYYLGGIIAGLRTR